MSEEFYELYSRRHRDLEEDPNLYEYDRFPREFRAQVFHILRRYFFTNRITQKFDEYFALRNDLAAEFGRLLLTDTEDWLLDFQKFYCISTRTDIDFLFESSDGAPSKEILDSIDYVFHFLWVQHHGEANLLKAVSELNQRFKQHYLGYEFIEGEIIRKDTEVAHEKIIKPALRCLGDSRFSNAEKELLDAFSYYLEDDYSNTVLYACKAFESTMKIICSAKEFPYDPDKDTAKGLLSILKNEKFFPAYMDDHLNALIKVMEAGVPTIRNRTSGHGGGVAPKVIDSSYAEYALNLSCSNIIFLFRQYQNI